MQPTGDQIRRLTDVLLDAFTYTALRTLAGERLDVDIERVLNRIFIGEGNPNLADLPAELRQSAQSLLDQPNG